jgi:hypothetical protein
MLQISISDDIAGISLISLTGTPAWIKVGDSRAAFEGSEALRLLYEEVMVCV